MDLKAGDRIEVESEPTERPARTGVVEEVVHGPPSGSLPHPLGRRAESIYTPAAGALRRAERA